MALMKIKDFAFLSLLGLGLLGAGCVATEDGRTKPAAWFGNDEFRSRYDRSMPRVLVAARETLKSHGVLTADNSINHSINARINEREVFVRCREIDQRVTEIVIQVRTKFGSTDLDLARLLDKEIAIQLTIMPP
jgi:hypothetical protein